MALKVFISYAHEDAKWLDELEKMLRPLENDQTIDSFSDRKFDIGAEWDETIEQKLEESDLIIFLVTFAFLGSKYITRVENDQALKQHKENRSRILPIIAEECDWTSYEWARIDARPKKDSKVLPLEDWDKPHQALTTISQDIREWAKSWDPVRTKAADELTPANPDTNPYLGLASFEPKHKDDFFGREKLIELLWSKIAEKKLTLLSGASGSGKSSLVNAGIIPRLMRDPANCIVPQGKSGPRDSFNL